MKIKTILLAITFVFITCKAQNNISNTKENNITNNSKTVLFTIDGMACQEGCANTIQENLLQLNGISNATVSYPNANATITYNPTKISLEQLKRTITKTKVKDYAYTIKDTSIKTKE